MKLGTKSVLTAALDRLFARREIVNCARELYLRRWYVFRSAPFAVFLHNFVRSDEDRALHDHPWSFLVIPLWRGYVEHHVCRQCDERGFHLPDGFMAWNKWWQEKCE